MASIWGAGWEAQEGGDICARVADLLCCIAETNRTLQSNYTPIFKTGCLQGHELLQKGKEQPLPWESEGISTPSSSAGSQLQFTFSMPLTGPPAGKLLYGVPTLSSWVKKQEEELKGIQSRKEEMKLPMLTDGMTVYVEKFQ